MMSSNITDWHIHIIDIDDHVKRSNETKNKDKNVANWYHQGKCLIKTKVFSDLLQKL